MVIYVGSKNPSKINAVERAIVDYEILKRSRVIGLDVNSGVRPQPMSWVEIFLGAERRAKEAAKIGGNCVASIGIESGLVKVSKRDAYINLCAVVVKRDGKYFYGSSQGFQMPKKIMNHVLRGKDLSEASHTAKVTTSRNIGSVDGLIEILTGGRISRYDYTIAALKVAFINFENKGLYL